MPSGSPECPKTLSDKQRALWQEYIPQAYWLTKIDAVKATIFICLLAEFLAAPKRMPVTRIKQMRLVGAELGFDPPSRARMGRGKEDPFAKYT